MKRHSPSIVTLSYCELMVVTMNTSATVHIRTAVMGFVVLPVLQVDLFSRLFFLQRLLARSYWVSQTRMNPFSM